jgi:hypothetical protein
VASETAARVQKIVARTGDVPNQLAGGLASRKTRLITVIVPTIANQVFAETIGMLVGLSHEKVGRAAADDLRTPVQRIRLNHASSTSASRS